MEGGALLTLNIWRESLQNWSKLMVCILKTWIVLIFASVRVRWSTIMSHKDMFESSQLVAMTVLHPLRYRTPWCRKKQAPQTWKNLLGHIKCRFYSVIPHKYPPTIHWHIDMLITPLPGRCLSRLCLPNWFTEKKGRNKYPPAGSNWLAAKTCWY